MGEAEIIRIDKRRIEETRCAGTTASGQRCRNKASENGRCRRHPVEAPVPTRSRFDAEVERLLAFARRRLTGDYPTDDFGFDPDLTENIIIPMLRPLFDKWWRVEQRGVENIPATGPALLVANHSGTIPWDALMMKVGLLDATGRHCRLLAEDLPFRIPVVGEVARKTGTSLSCEEDATRLLDGGELVCAFPEGYNGLGKPYSERYKLQQFSGTFTSVALAMGIPIIPVSIIGAEEIHPMLRNIRSVARLLGLPYMPVTPTFPLLGPLGLVPLPTKWTIEYGEPVETAPFTPDAAMDPMLVFNLTDQIRETIQQMLYRDLLARRSILF